jgi:thiaminase
MDRPDVQGAWEKFIKHDFVEGMGQGTLPVERFKEYLVQDYLYLVQFARSNALAAYKSSEMDSIAASAQIVLHIQREMALHIDYCASFGLSKQEMEASPETIGKRLAFVPSVIGMSFLILLSFINSLHCIQPIHS